MKKRNAIGSIITILIVIAIILFAIYIKTRPPNGASEEVAKCIGENAVLYVQLGCPHCDNQEKMFGENVKNLNIVLCNKDWNVCNEAGIKGTPSWKINGQVISGTKSIEKLRELTGC